MPTAKASGNKDENNNNSSSSSGRKSSAAAARQGGQEQQQQQALKCPRCDSQNTKFCYYNNYSLTQPRHFCKTCRRYWTKGGALRNVPIGGGCRKNKKMMKSSSSSSRLSLGGDSKDSSCSTSSDIGGLKFFHGLTPAMDFQLGTGMINFPRVLHHHQQQSYNQFPSFADISSTTSAPNISSTTSGFTTLDPSLSTTPLLGFNFPFNNGGVQEMGNNNNIASSIESLSSINQDLHWKLQQQRLAAMFCGPEMKDNNSSNNVVPVSSSSFGLDHHNHSHNHEKPQTILFHNLEETTKDDQQEEELYSRKEGETEWFFGDSYNNNNNGGSVAAAVTTSSTPMINNSNGSWMNNGMQSWSNLNNQYTSLP